MSAQLDAFCAWARPCEGTYLNKNAFNAIEVWRAAQAAMPAPASQVPTSAASVEEMSLRDHFAAQALMGVSSDPGCTAEMCARFAYEVADAMMKARAL